MPTIAWCAATMWSSKKAPTKPTPPCPASTRTSALDAGDYRLCDDGSEFGTRVFRDGRSIEVPAGDRRGEKLRPGDEIYLGRACLSLNSRVELRSDWQAKRPMSLSFLIGCILLDLLAGEVITNVKVIVAAFGLRREEARVGVDGDIEVFVVIAGAQTYLKQA